MTTNRLVLLGLLAVLCLTSASAQTPPAPTFEERLAARAAESRHAVHFKDSAFSGPGWDLLLKEGQASRFFLVGEEHGVAEAPAFVPWFNSLVEPDITEPLFLRINGVAFLITVALSGALAATREPAIAVADLAWLGFLMFANALLHLTATVVHHRYSPGTPVGTPVEGSRGV